MTQSPFKLGQMLGTDIGFILAKKETVQYFGNLQETPKLAIFGIVEDERFNFLIHSSQFPSLEGLCIFKFIVIMAAFLREVGDLNFTRG